MTEGFEEPQLCLRAGLLGHVDTVFVSVHELGQRTSCDSAASYLPSGSHVDVW